MDVPPSKPLSVVVAAVRDVTRSALWSLVEAEPTLTPAGAASDLAETVRLVRAATPDVVLVDNRLLGRAGVARLSMLAAAAPLTAVILIGMGDHPSLPRRARAAGAAGYVRLDQAAERLASAALSAVAR
jgi:NarL family two-component system response regulator LiaR